MQKVKDLLGRETFTVHQSVLSISNQNVTIKDGRTSNAVNTFPLSSVAMVQVGGVVWVGMEVVDDIPTLPLSHSQ